MAHFYGFIQGQAGDATRMGSKRSGYRAWAQNTTTRVAVDFDYSEGRKRDLVRIVIDGSTQNYGAGRRIYLANSIDIDAVFEAFSDGDIRTTRQIEKASEALDKANTYAEAWRKRKKR